MKKNTGSGRKVILIQFFALISNLESELENFAPVFFNWFLMILNIFDARSQDSYSIFFYFFGWSLNKIWFRAKKYSWKFFLKSIFKKIKKWYLIIIAELSQNWYLLYLLNYQFLWKFTWILICSELIFTEDKPKKYDLFLLLTLYGPLKFWSVIFKFRLQMWNLRERPGTFQSLR